MALFFLKLDGVPSKSIYKHHAHWLECIYFQLPNPLYKETDVVVVLPTAVASGILLKLSVEGKVFGSAVLDLGLENADASFALQLRLRLTDVIITSYSQSFHESSRKHVDRVSFNFRSIIYEFGSATQILHEQVHLAQNLRGSP